MLKTFMWHVKQTDDDADDDGLDEMHDIDPQIRRR